jgi:hypothetical protein
MDPIRVIGSKRATRTNSSGRILKPRETAVSRETERNARLRVKANALTQDQLKDFARPGAEFAWTHAKLLPALRHDVNR